MSGRIRLYRFVIVCITFAAVLGSSLVSASVSSAASATDLTWKTHRVEYPLSDPDTDDVHDLGGSVITWNAPGGLVAYDARTRKFFNLANRPRFVLGAPRTDGRTVVGRLDEDRIGVYDIAVGSLRSFEVSSNPTPHIRFGDWTADVSGDLIAFTTDEYDLGVSRLPVGNAFTRLNNVWLGSPIVADDLVVAMRWDTIQGPFFPAAIVYYDARTGETNRLDAGYPVFSAHGRKVVWKSALGVRILDVDSGKSRPLNVAPEVVSMALSERFLVWSDGTNVHLLELASGRTHPLWQKSPRLGHRVSNPHISGNWVTWFENGQGKTGDEYINVCEIVETKSATSKGGSTGTGTRAVASRATSAKETTPSVEATEGADLVASTEPTETPTPETAGGDDAAGPDAGTDNPTEATVLQSERSWLPWPISLAVVAFAATGVVVWVRRRRAA